VPDVDLPPLTDEQRAAVTHDGGHLLIVAGAGTGKTTTLSARLAHLVVQLVRQAALLVLARADQAPAPPSGGVPRHVDADRPPRLVLQR